MLRARMKKLIIIVNLMLKARMEKLLMAKQSLVSSMQCLNASSALPGNQRQK